MITVKEIASKEEADILTAFGWHINKEVKRISHRVHGVSRYQTVYEIERDDEMPNYNLYKEYESEFYEAKSKLIVEPKMDMVITICLLLLLVIPGIIYIICENKHISKIKEKNKENINIMNNALVKARAL